MGEIISFSSGKGGTGKTFCSVNTACELASKGYKVLIFDIDINCSNVFIMLHVKPQNKLQKYFENNADLEESIVKSEYGVDVISAGINIQRFIQFENDYNLTRLSEDIVKLKDKYDYIIIDHPAGISQGMMKFYAVSDHIVLIANPEVTALTDLYRLMKMLYVGDLADKIYLIINKVKNIDWAVNLYKEIQRITKAFSIEIELKLLGPILFDEDRVMESVQKRTPFVCLYPKTSIKGGFSLIITRFLYETGYMQDDESIEDKTFSNFF